MGDLGWLGPPPGFQGAGCWGNSAKKWKLILCSHKTNLKFVHLVLQTAVPDKTSTNFVFGLGEMFFMAAYNNSSKNSGHCLCVEKKSTRLF